MASSVTVRNCVASAFFGDEIDIDALCEHEGVTLHVDTNIDAANLKVSDPSASALVYRNGRVILTGVNSENQIREAMDLVFKVVSTVTPLVAYTRLCVENIVGTADLEFEVCLQSADDWMKRFTSVQFDSANPTKGLRFNPEDLLDSLSPIKVLSPIKALVFSSGHVIVSGAKTQEDLEKTWEIVRGVIKPFDVEIATD
jgi:TATA-box binding protein (TBP) (component of TFIID and TFIIIB)